MALTRVVQKDLYQYSEEIIALSKEDVVEARALFDDYRNRGIILNGSFDDEIWSLTNEVTKSRFDFSLSKDLYSAKAAKSIGCSYPKFCEAIRVYAVNSLNYSILTVQSRIKTIMRFARSLDLPEPGSAAGIVSDFLDLLPGHTPLRDKVHALSFCEQKKSTKSPRILADYVSYFRFSRHLNQFWATATQDERLLYFPIYLWWNLTSILPLRVTEFLLTPRDCLIQIGDLWRIRVRRTKLKTQNGRAKHSIGSDYEILDYPINEDLARAISSYIDQTRDDYTSDIDVVFSKHTQWRLANTPGSPNDHYTVSNLTRVLDLFYEEVLAKQFGFKVISDPKGNPGPNEINRIKLGDTRHVSIIGLMVSGSSLVACKELSRHFDIYSAQNYYSNITAFLNALNFEYITPQSGNMVQPTSALAPVSAPLVSDLKQVTAIPDGYCFSKRYRDGDFSDCSAAVDQYGQIGECSHCKYLIPDRTKFKEYSKQADHELMKSCALIHDALSCYQANETMPDLERILSKLQVAASQYLHLTIMERYAITKENEYS